jgi:L-malate glycosyltransferase
MRILYFSKSYSLHDYNFLNKISESNHEIFFLQLEKGSTEFGKMPLPKNVKYVGYLCQKAPPIEGTLEMINLMPLLESFLKKVKPNLIHAGPIQSCGFLISLANFHPFLLMSWGSDILVDTFKDDTLKWITKYTLNSSDCFICDCDTVRNLAKTITFYKDADIVQFPWGIDLDIFKPGDDTLKLRSIKNWEDSSVLLSTRMWEPIYGIDVLLKGFFEAFTYNPKLRLVLLGDGSQASEIIEFIKMNNLENIVYSPGIANHDKLVDFFRSADIYVSCSHSDGSSVSLLEAMGCGLPVIVTDLESNHEWVNSNENGLLFVAGNPTAFAKAILEISNKNGEELNLISKNNREVVEKRADWNLNIEKLVSKYDQIGVNYVERKKQNFQ